MKKIPLQKSLLLLGLILTLSLSACSSTAPTTAQEGASTQATSSTLN